MTFKHKGYTLQQGAKVNYHYMIFAPDGHMVMHVPHNKPVTEEKAKEFIDGYLSIAEKFDEIFDEIRTTYKKMILIFKAVAYGNNSINKKVVGSIVAERGAGQIRG